MLFIFFSEALFCTRKNDPILNQIKKKKIITDNSFDTDGTFFEGFFDKIKSYISAAKKHRENRENPAKFRLLNHRSI